MNALADNLAMRLYGRNAEAAQLAGECIKCRRPVDVVTLAPVDLAEYRITAICPDCWAALFGCADGEHEWEYPTPIWRQCLRCDVGEEDTPTYEDPES